MHTLFESHGSSAACPDPENQGTGRGADRFGASFLQWHCHRPSVVLDSKPVSPPTLANQAKSGCALKNERGGHTPPAA